MSEVQAAAGANKRERRGVVLKNAMQKTVVVEVVRHVRHAMYGKAQKRRVRYKAHDESNACSVGDQVLLEETRPMSKTKRWRVKQIVQRTAGV